jgi:hypothetical protein
MHNAGRVGATGNSDAFVTKLDPSGSSLVYSTYLGGADDDGGSAIAVDVDGNVFVAGSTSSTDFPISRDTCPPGLQGILDAFVTMLDPDGSAVVYSTYLGGSADDSGNAIAVDSGGNAYVAGVTGPRVPPLPCPQCTDDFPTTPHAFQRHYGGGQRDAFVVKIAELPLPQPATSTANISSPTAMPSAAASVADSGQSAGTGGGGAFDWLTLSALFGAAALVRRRRAER